MTEPVTDEIRVDLIENAARTPGGITLFAGQPLAPNEGLRLQLDGRTLREAVDTAFGMSAMQLKGAPHVLLTRELLTSAITTWVIDRKAELLPDTRGQSDDDLPRLEALADSLTERLWSLIGGTVL